MARLLILDHMAAVADPMRCRLLRILERHELTVSELCAVLQLPQSTVSRHLKTLADDDWVVSRREGTSRFYSMAPDELAPDARRLWLLIREQVAASASADQDDRRLTTVLAARRTRSQAFFSSAAERWDKLREEQFGRAFHLHALLGLLDESWIVGDLGCGTGQLSKSLAPFVKSIIAVDGSTEMLQSARSSLRGISNVELRRGELERLPLDDMQLDAAVLMLVLHHVPEPSRVLAEAARVLRAGGRLLIVDMMPHERLEYQQRMGHVWLGFSDKQIVRYVTDAGFEGCRVRPLPSDSAAKGPSLFAASATRVAEQRDRQPAGETVYSET